MLFFVPRSLFATVPMGGIAHEAWHNLLVRGVPRSAGEVMLRTYHDADTAKDCEFAERALEAGLAHFRHRLAY